MRVEVDPVARAIGVSSAGGANTDPVQAATKIERLRTWNDRPEYMQPALSNVRGGHIDCNDFQPGTRDAFDTMRNRIEYVGRPVRVLRYLGLSRRGKDEFEGLAVFRQKGP